MPKYTKSTSTIALMTATLFFGNAAFAQNSSVFTDEIIVTATKKSDGENVQDTNIAITAIGADQLEAFQVRNLSDLSFKIPNVQLDEVGTVKGVANFTVRGLGVNSSIPSIDPTVGTFVDGVYLGINAGVVLDQFDIDSVEVLRGPQGVLFGRNVTGGAVVLNTGNPTDEFTFKAKTAVDSGLRGTGENYLVQGVVSGPIFGNLKGKLAGYYNEDKGWHENLLDNSNFGASETKIIRAALEYDGNEGINILAKLELGDTEGDGPASQNHPTEAGPTAGIPALTNPALGFDRESFDFSIDNRGFANHDWLQGSLRVDFDTEFGNGKVTNILGYRDYSLKGSSDIDATPVGIFNGGVGVEQDQLSFETRYNGRFYDDKLDFTTGFFYFEQNLEYSEQRDVFVSAAGSVFPFDGGGVQDHHTFGVFASGEYDVTDRLSVNAGVRYTEEKKEADIALVASVLTGGVGACIITEGDDRSSTFCPTTAFPDFETDNWSPKIGLGYEVQDNLRLYGHWSRAYRAGGFNLRNTALDPTDPLQSPGPFEDERIDNFEIGFKSEPIPGARINVSAFFNDISNLQREINVPSPTTVVQQVITNSADAEIYGLEADALWPLTDNFVVYGSVGITEAQYTDVFVNLLASSPTEISLQTPALLEAAEDLDIPRLAPLTANAGFTYFLETGFGLATLNGNYAHRDRAAFTDNNLGFFNAQDRFDASLGFDIQDTGVNLTVYGKNLTNEVLHGGDTVLSSAVNGTFSPLAKGRVIGVELNYEY